MDSGVVAAASSSFMQDSALVAEARSIECDEEGVTLEDVCAFLQEERQPASGDVSSKAGKGSRAQRNHACVWPGCGKAFSSRWGLERHARNHRTEPVEEGAESTSFVEKRLSERLKGLQQVLERLSPDLENAIKTAAEAASCRASCTASCTARCTASCFSTGFSSIPNSEVHS